MQISAVNEGLSLKADIGVIASIVLLGLEMLKNTEMMHSKMRKSIGEHHMFLYEKWP